MASSRYKYQCIFYLCRDKMENVLGNHHLFLLMSNVNHQCLCSGNVFLLEKTSEGSTVLYKIALRLCPNTCLLVLSGCGLQVVGCRVVVCRDAAAGACRRAACRYYHIPVQLPPAIRPP